MSYQNQNFSNGEVLTAAQLNHMENGIADAESTANATKGIVDKIIDPTLSVSGKAADAAKVGEAVGRVEEDFYYYDSVSIRKLYKIVDASSIARENIVNKYINKNSGKVEDNATVITVAYTSKLGVSNKAILAPSGYNICVNGYRTAYTNIITESVADRVYHTDFSSRALLSDDSTINYFVSLQKIDKTAITTDDKTAVSTALYKMIGLYGIERNTPPKTKPIELTYTAGTTITAEGNIISSSGNTVCTAKIILPVGTRYRLAIKSSHFVSVSLADQYGARSRCYYTGMIELVADKSPVNIAISTIDGSAIDIGSIDLTAEHVLSKNNSGYYDAVVAAYDSDEYSKSIADFVCDGKDDEVEIQCAVNCNLSFSTRPKANILLLRGSYNINNFNNIYSPMDKTVGRGKLAICAYPSCAHDHSYAVEIDGQDGAIMYLTDIAANARSENADDEYTILGLYRQGEENMGLLGGTFSLSLKNFRINANNFKKPVICIDAIGAEEFNASGVRTFVYNSGSFNFDKNAPVPGVIGIRCGQGSGYGTNNFLKHCFAGGMYEGLSLNGEHFVVEDCLQYHCWIGFTVGNCNVRRTMEHPNIFIGNSVERCYRFGILNDFGAVNESTSPVAKRTIVYIGGSTEPTWKKSDGTLEDMLPMKEIVKDAYRGTFETDWTVLSTPFEAGSGGLIAWRNYQIDVAGQKYKMTYPENRKNGDMFFRQTETPGEAKPYWVYNGKWYDATGAIYDPGI